MYCANCGLDRQAHDVNDDCPSAQPGDIKYINQEVAIDKALNAAADMVNHPPHYADGKVECIDALEAATQGLAGLDAVCTANAIKYLWRWKKKNGHEDLRKARWYINKLLGDTP